MSNQKHLLTNLTVNEVSLVSKGANGKVFDVIKSATANVSVAEKVLAMTDEQFTECVSSLKEAFTNINKTEGGKSQMEDMDKVMETFESTMTTMNQNFSAIAKSLEGLTTGLDTVLKAVQPKELTDEEKAKQEEELKKAQEEEDAKKARAEEESKKAQEDKECVSKALADTVKTVSDLASVVTKTVEGMGAITKSLESMTKSVEDVTKSVEGLASIPVGSNALEDVHKSAEQSASKWPSILGK